MRANASRYSIDKQRVGLWGVSAGGQLAAITATTCVPGEPESACVQAVAVWYGIFDFGPLIANPASPPAQSSVFHAALTAQGVKSRLLLIAETWASDGGQNRQ